MSENSATKSNLVIVSYPVESYPVESHPQQQAQPPALKKYEPRFVWKFNKNSLAVRFFLWVYGMKPSELNSFCVLWWGSTAMPITVPVRMVVLIVQTLVFCAREFGRGVVWAGDGIINSPPMRAVSKARQQKLEREKAAKRQRAGEDILARELWILYYNCESPPPRPVVPSIPSRIATAVGKGADHVVAYFQEHPGIGQTVDVSMDWLGKIIVRGILYPLMILVPLSAFGYAIWEAVKHASGISGGFDSAWDTTSHGVGTGVALAWKPLLLSLGMGFACIVLLLAVGWLVFRGDESEYNDKPPTKTEMVLRVVGKPTGWVFEKLENGIVLVATGICWVALFFWRVVLVKIGHACTGVGKFLVLGHHVIKSRSCPRIEIEE